MTDDRREVRDQVHYAARAFGPDARQIELTLVNLSPHGLMGKCFTRFAVRDRLRVVLPVTGSLVAEIRWCADDRVGAQVLGCRFEHAVDLASYYELLATLVKTP